MTCDGKFTDTESGYSVVFDDDGKVAYAYMLDQGDDIIADVWLYNRCATPSEPEWRDPDNMPFANPVGFVKEDIETITTNKIEDVKIDWGLSSDNLIQAGIYIRGNLMAILVEGAKPGRSFMASKNGPLAKVLENK